MGLPVVLIVDDDKNTRDGLVRALRRHYDVLSAESAESALEVLRKSPVDIMLSDMRMPGMDGLRLLKQVVAEYPRTICILLTAYGSVETAVEAMKYGAYDFLTKPINLDHLDLLLERASKVSQAQDAVSKSAAPGEGATGGLGEITGDSLAMRRVFEIVRQAAPTQASVLIQGPSGTGKELIARAIHRLSHRASGPFIPVHCAALSPTLLESELFGHERGAFTGATAMRKGRFEMADGGTLFLDEISEIDLSTQVKLLRVLEERRFERVGGEETIEVDIRVIAATNRNLREYVAQGKFREDLYFRLNVVDILLPPLRERTGDIPLLVARFLKEYSERNGKHFQGMTPGALRLLCAYDWPGNVRELRNVIERMVVLAHSDELCEADVPEQILRRNDPAPSVPVSAVSVAGVSDLSAQTRNADESIVPAPSGDGAAGRDSLAETEREKIMQVLAENRGNRTKAAQVLGISRRTLHRKLHAYGVTGHEKGDA